MGRGLSVYENVTGPQKFESYKWGDGVRGRKSWLLLHDFAFSSQAGNKGYKIDSETIPNVD